MIKLYNDSDTSLVEFAEEMERRNPVYIYTYDDFVLVSDVEIDEDDVENVITEAIKEWQEQNDDLDDDE